MLKITEEVVSYVFKSFSNASHAQDGDPDGTD